ncbi:Decaprenyl diphosphate synthase-like protein [Blakeslea trispora]|nr:Decaprenyl diphosphate synthase-like protein [Blakeslea trispora]
MTTIVTTNNDKVEYNSLQLSSRTQQIPKYKSAINTIESQQELKNRSRALQEKSNSLLDVSLTMILYIFHFIYLSYIAFESFKSYFAKAYHTPIPNIYERIQFDKQQLTKLPKHLTINLSRDLFSTRTLKDWDRIMMDICLVTCWSWQIGIKEVSVYDVSGAIKSMETELYKQQSAMLYEWMSASSIKNPDIRFTILSAENGKPHMGHVTQEMIKANTQAIDVNSVDAYIHLNTISDPDLMIVYDGLPHHHVSLEGYPPWHIRLTEIINCSSDHRLDYSVFSKCLYRFSKVEQRFGR